VKEGDGGTVNVQEALVAALERARETVAGLTPAGVRKNEPFLKGMLALVKNAEGFLAAHGDDGRLKLTIDMGRAAEVVRAALGGRRR
jgi:hypothetical protein